MPPQFEKQQQLQPKSVSFHGGDVTNDVDASTGGPVIVDDKTKSSSPSSTMIHLRWSKIKKEVIIKESNSGLLRGSIAAPTPESKTELAAVTAAAAAATAAAPKKKVILSQVSGEASPGQVLAMMG